MGLEKRIDDLCFPARPWREDRRQVPIRLGGWKEGRQHWERQLGGRSLGRKRFVSDVCGSHRAAVRPCVCLPTSVVSLFGDSYKKSSVGCVTGRRRRDMDDTLLQAMDCHMDYQPFGYPGALEFS